MNIIDYKNIRLEDIDSILFTQSTETQNSLSDTIKISELNDISDLNMDDLFIISRKEGTSYKYSKSVEYETLYKDIRDSLLSDGEFIEEIKKKLSGDIEYSSSYPTE